MPVRGGNPQHLRRRAQGLGADQQTCIGRFYVAALLLIIIFLPSLCKSLLIAWSCAYLTIPYNTQSKPKPGVAWCGDMGHIPRMDIESALFWWNAHNTPDLHYDFVKVSYAHYMLTWCFVDGTNTIGVKVLIMKYHDRTYIHTYIHITSLSYIICMVHWLCVDAP